MKKLCSLVLAFVLTLSLLPLTALNAAAAVVETEVSFTVTAPSAGTTSETAPAVTVSEKSDYSLEWTGWSTAEGYEPEGIVTFEEGETYYLLVKIKGSERIDFYYNTQADVRFKGEGKVERTLSYGNNDSTGYSYITYLVSVKAGEAKFQGAINAVTLDVKPVVGRRTSERAPAVTAPENRGYTVSDAHWCDSTGEPLTEVLTFTPGETYYIAFTLVTDDNCWWNQAILVPVIVNGGEMAGVLSTCNSTEGCWADGVIAVTAIETPENVVLDVDPIFTLPQAGTTVTFDHSSYRISATPAPSTFITFPEGAEYTYSSYWTALWCDAEDETINEDFTLYAGIPYYFEVALKPVSGKSFNMDYTEISMQNAELVAYEKEYGNLYVTFRFVIEPSADDCQIFFDPNTGEGSMPSVYIPSGMAYELPGCTFTHKEADFTAWSVGGEELSPGTKITVTENTGVKAIWTYKSSQMKDISTDTSTATVKAVLELTDPATGETTSTDVSSETVPAEYGKPFTDACNEAVESAKQALIARAREYGATFTETEENPGTSSVMVGETKDQRTFNFEGAKDENGNYRKNLVISGEYSHDWQITVTLKAEGTAPAGNILLGDATGDGIVNVNDVTAIQRHTAEYEALTGDCLKAADIDGDGEVTINDATQLQRWIAEFDVPYPINQYI